MIHSQPTLQSSLYRQLHKLLDIEEVLTKALGKENEMTPETTELIAAFDAATDRIAARIQKLVDASKTLSPEDKAAFQAEVAKLNTLGEDSANPVPAGV